MSDHKSTEHDHLVHQLDAVLERAAVVVDHLDNFDEHREELEAGTREPDEVFDEQSAQDETELTMRWEESLLSIERRAVFEFWFGLGGPNTWAEVYCNIEKHQHWTEYDVRRITLRGAWWGDTTEREVRQDDPLWRLIAREIETIGESDG